ncbi:MAG TPA: hypothetical protein VGE18_02510 [Candidatus Paceibacterota bacterium]
MKTLIDIVQSGTAVTALGVTVFLILFFRFMKKQNKKYLSAVRIPNEICALLNKSDNHLFVIDSYAKERNEIVTRFAIEDGPTPLVYSGAQIYLCVFLYEDQYEFLKRNGIWVVHSSTAIQKLAASR